jgi:fused signal recognition particle receptor
LFGSLKDRFRGIAQRITETLQEGPPAEAPPPGKGAVTVKERAKALLHGETVIDTAKLEDLFWDLQVALLESDVALPVSEAIIAGLKRDLHGKKIKRSEVEGEVVGSLKRFLRELFPPPPDDLVSWVKEKGKRPFVIVFVGVNGCGKTTTIAKIARLFQEGGLTPVIAAADTYRAGAIEQLAEHARRLDVRLIHHEKGSDPAAVAYDAVKHAESKGKDVVLIDTSGRMETNVNLLEEMKKIVRVAKPDLTLFVAEAIAGNAAVEQAERFAEAVPIDGVILTKADADARGGAALSIVQTIHKPIFFLGTGQGYGDLLPFRTEWLLTQIFGSEG